MDDIKKFVRAALAAANARRSAANAAVHDIEARMRQLQIDLDAAMAEALRAEKSLESLEAAAAQLEEGA